MAFCTTSVLYPPIETNESRHSTPVLDRTKMTSITTKNALTIKAGVKRGVEDVPFRLNPQVESILAKNKLEMLPELKKCDSEQLDRDYCYYFTLERAMLSNS
ncbi:unnamed protein product [Brugia timori]|uniref:UMA domain-containing protein n=1 Tax=Brugia timori TaxID=42155 RepID=A0A0R3Q4S8_9BILA|nr:unnamed protein product [Brugia timori]